jgi:drug/metabolite transporter (DMT)-like permease
MLRLGSESVGMCNALHLREPELSIFEAIFVKQNRHTARNLEISNTHDCRASPYPSSSSLTPGYDPCMTKRAKIFLAFASVYVLWGSTFVVIRYVAQILHPAFVSGLRYLIAGLISMTYLLLRRRPVRLSGAERWRVTLLGFIMFTINTTLVSYGGKILSAGLTALFVASIPLFIAVLEAVVPGETSMTKIGWLGTVTGFVGLAVLTSHGVRGQSLTSDSALASIGLMVGAMAWAIGSVMARRMEIKVSPLASSSWQMLIAGSINLLIGVACGGLRSSHWTTGAWLAMLYLAIFGSLAGYTSYIFLLRNVRLSAAATYAYVNPIVAVLLGWVLLREKLYGTEWVGMGIVLVSVAVVIASRPSRLGLSSKPTD